MMAWGGRGVSGHNHDDIQIEQPVRARVELRLVCLALESSANRYVPPRCPAGNCFVEVADSLCRLYQVSAERDVNQAWGPGVQVVGFVRGRC